MRNADFSRGWPALSPASAVSSPIGPPDAMLELILGEVAQVVTKGQKVLPRKALSLGYRFRSRTSTLALADLFAKSPDPASTPKPVAAGVA